MALSDGNRNGTRYIYELLVFSAYETPVIPARDCCLHNTQLTTYSRAPPDQSGSAFHVHHTPRVKKISLFRRSSTTTKPKTRITHPLFQARSHEMSPCHTRISEINGPPGPTASCMFRPMPMPMFSLLPAPPPTRRRGHADHGFAAWKLGAPRRGGQYNLRP